MAILQIAKAADRSGQATILERDLGGLKAESKRMGVANASLCAEGFFW